jgi:hypothetical protein
VEDEVGRLGKVRLLCAKITPRTSKNYNLGGNMGRRRRRGRVSHSIRVLLPLVCLDEALALTSVRAGTAGM